MSLQQEAVGHGGRMDGMIAAAEHAVKAVDARTTIVPGHSPLGDRAALERYRTMLATIRDITTSPAARARPTSPRPRWT